MMKSLLGNRLQQVSLEKTYLHFSCNFFWLLENRRDVAFIRQLPIQTLKILVVARVVWIRNWKWHPMRDLFDDSTTTLVSTFSDLILNREKGMELLGF